jgi:DNA-binding transcriptional ArsR family regulator
MSKNKNKNYNEDDVRLARFAKALGHPARIAILRHLASLSTCCFNEVSQEMPLANSTVSQHMSELKNAGLIQGSFEPPMVKYCINKKNWKIAKELLNDFVNIKIVKNTNYE